MIVFGAGGAALAVWFDLRFPSIAPSELRGILVHAICAYGLFLASDTLFDLVASEAVWQRVGGVFAIHVPIVVYMLIVSLWVLKLLRGAMSAAR